MKTQTWTPAGTVDEKEAEENLPLGWMGTRLIFVSGHQAPVLLELVTSAYQAVDHLRRGLPFSVTDEKGEIACEYKPTREENFIAPAFNVAITMMREIMGSEATAAKHLVLDELEERFRMNAPADAPAGAQPPTTSYAADETLDEVAVLEEIPRS